MFSEKLLLVGYLLSVTTLQYFKEIVKVRVYNVKMYVSKSLKQSFTRILLHHRIFCRRLSHFFDLLYNYPIYIIQYTRILSKLTPFLCQHYTFQFRLFDNNNSDTSYTFQTHKQVYSVKRGPNDG